jgi:formate dehydrogenase gamma subunit
MQPLFETRRDALLLLLVVLVCSPGFAQEDDLCWACHADADIFDGTEDASRLVVREEEYFASMHGEAGVTCVDCHADLADSEDFPHADELQPADCSACHIDVQEVFGGSLHGYALERGNPRAPTCASCHGSHDIQSSSDPRSSTHKSRQHDACAVCHGTAGLLTDQIVKLPQSLAGFARSVHGVGAETGSEGAVSCADCHSVHGLRGTTDPASRIHPVNVATTCGACHETTRREYENSIHGRALRAGVSDSPTCTDCHGEHLILSSRDPDSKTYPSRLATETCGACHNDPVIIAKYNLRGDVVGSYVDSYHGWAMRREYMSSANCVSCHTAHSVLPQEHPESTIHADNVVETCRQCHEAADRKFAASYTHEAVSITANPINRWIRNVYWVIIAVVIGGMIVHNLVIMNFYAVKKRRESARMPQVRRLDPFQIIQHLLMIVSFIGLTITGFALRFPEAWWVRYLSALGMSEPVRSNLHRIFAVVLVLVGLSHVLYILFAKRGRREFRKILPARLDLRQLRENLLYHTWRRQQPAEFDRYDYTQKAEYWALAWGTVLMAVTGVVLWYPETAVKLFPAWIVTASQTVHYYEAWLATLAIFFWHIFFVVFHPDVYPMSWTWLTGKMTTRSVEKHHPRWYREEIAPGAGGDRPTADSDSDEG